jgi:2-methylisocitrate lyase-like PEP mutase family enzyme
MSLTQPELYERFLSLHQRPQGFVMPNPWDAVSALLLKEAGFEALGTSSAALAASLGRIDGRHAITRDEHIAHAQLIGRITGLPVNGDFEDGYGQGPEDVAATVEAAIAAGLAGIGIEDTGGDPSRPIRDFDDAVARVAAAAKAATGRIVLTGRTDNFIQGRPDLADTIRRLTAFAEVGADVLYAPYPANMDEVAAIVRAVAPKPVNLVVGTRAGTLPVADLQNAGVKRISLGAALYTRVMADMQKAARELAAGDLASASAGLSLRGVLKMIAGAAGEPGERS